jgi:predicted nucleic acid-binding protein
VSDLWIVNASPLIVLAKIGHLDLLRRLASDVVVPQAVVEEVLAGPADDPARVALEAGWGTRCDPGPIPVRLHEWGLGRGETAVLAAALQRPGSTAILDDGSRRTCARALGVPVFGTIGVILRSRKAGLVPAVEPLITAVRDAGLRIDDDLLSSVLREAAEKARP